MSESVIRELSEARARLRHLVVERRQAGDMDILEVEDIDILDDVYRRIYETKAVIGMLRKLLRQDE